MVSMMLTTTDEEGEETQTRVPAKWEICHRCEGAGTHTNPNIDGHGITSEEWNGPDWDDESRETYMSGGYDVTCEAGCTNGKVLFPDAASATPAQKALIEEWENDRAESARSDAEDRRTRYMESGGWDR